MFSFSFFGRLRPTSHYNSNDPIFVDVAVKDRLHHLLFSGEYYSKGSDIDYSSFIDRACELAEEDFHNKRKSSN